MVTENILYSGFFYSYQVLWQRNNRRLGLVDCCNYGPAVLPDKCK